MANNKKKIFFLCKLLIIATFLVFPLGMSAQTDNMGQTCKTDDDCFGEKVFCSKETGSLYGMCTADVVEYFKTRKLEAIEDEDSSSQVIFTPQIGIPRSTDFNRNQPLTLTQSNTSYIAKYIKALYDYSLSIVAILATIMLMIGGYLWAMSAGDVSKITQAKEIMIGAIAGLLIMLAAVTLLGRINPDLVNFKVNKIVTMYKVKMDSCCEYNTSTQRYSKGLASQEECEKDGGTFYPLAGPVRGKYCADSGCCKCKVGGTWRRLWYSQSICSDKYNSTQSDTLTLSSCKTGCMLAARALDVSDWDYSFKWGYKCNSNDDCVLDN